MTKFRGEADLSKWTEGYIKANQEEFAVRLKADLEPKLNLPPTGDPRQESASIEKLFWGPTAIKIDDQGRIYVVDSCRFRIQVYCKGSRATY